jgi:hypothetical protein
MNNAWRERRSERERGRKAMVKKGMRLKYMFMNFNIQNGAFLCFRGVAIIGENGTYLALNLMRISY